MNRLVFDIECVGSAWDTLDATSQQHLLRGCKGDRDCESREKEKLALWPVTGQVIAIGMYNPDTEKAHVYFTAEEGSDTSYVKDGVTYKTGTEKEILQWFWRDVEYYDQIITFNGRGFDAPYILFRSMVHGLTATKDIMPHRYGTYHKDYHEHLDLADQLAHYGSTRRFSLHLTTMALGITSPKEDGIDGAAVQGFFEEGKYTEIAEYCMRDVYATADLYKKWHETYEQD